MEDDWGVFPKAGNKIQWDRNWKPKLKEDLRLNPAVLIGDLTGIPERTVKAEGEKLSNK